MNVVSAAEGPLKTLIIVSAVFAVVVLAMTYSEPFGTEYMVKTAARTACNDLSAEKRYKRPTDWEKTFVQKALQAGVRLNADQYDFKMDVNNEETTCTVVVAWRSSTPIFLLTDAVEMPPLKMIQRINMVHKVQRRY